ncbi:hypothetical protein CWD84_01320 [Bacillus siamensis]|uniref:Uncharacterized protein n=1 Tax=Bacillus siamensis TaxID=659243 RepID=A0AAI8HK38_9BACI|nr:hypothetical protein CWD84_01320 [Bacillus siamensis]
MYEGGLTAIKCGPCFLFQASFGCLPYCFDSFSSSFLLKGFHSQPITVVLNWGFYVFCYLIYHNNFFPISQDAALRQLCCRKRLSALPYWGSAQACVRKSRRNFFTSFIFTIS